MVVTKDSSPVRIDWIPHPHPVTVCVTYCTGPWESHVPSCATTVHAPLDGPHPLWGGDEVD